MNLLLYFLALFCLSQASILIKLAAAPPDVIGFWRLLTASLLFLPWALWKGSLLKTLKNPPREIGYIFLTALFFFGHLWTYFFAAQNTKIANCMIIFATNPLFTAAGSTFFFGEKFSWRLGLAYILALAGILLLVQHSMIWNPKSLHGELASLVSALLFAGYLLSGKKSRMSFSNSTYSGILYFLTAILFGLSGAIKSINFVDYPSVTWWSIAGTVFLPTLLGHALISYLMNQMNLNLMTCGKLIEPVLSALTAFFIFTERPPPGAYLAFGLTACAILVLFWPRRIGRQG
ncbi:MAG: DMT family transporter [Bdellovibrionaceae bacterium]|nr:DMT family transporter [Pseudobdellovibrionaceae bacterium]